MREVQHENCVQLYEVIEDRYEEEDEEGEDDQSEKLYMIMELAKYKEIMSWNENTYRFVPNPQLIRATNSAKNSTNAVKVDNGAIKSSNNLKGVESFICQ